MAEEKKKGFNIADIIGSVSKMDIGNQSRPQLEYIDIDLIDPDPRNRKVEGIPALAQNIALVGLQQPLAVRATPDAEGRYMAISGHRRREALKQLVDEGEERFRMVPCLVAPPGMSDAMVRLMILSGNMVTQSLTPAQMAEATKEMEDAIYQLKEEGHEFPGKVRDYVAEACGIAGSRVTRLKVIREKLTEDLKKYWESGDLKESVAYAFAKLSPEAQRLTADMVREIGAYMREPKQWHEGTVTYYAEKVKKELKPRKGPKGTCEACDRFEARLARMSSRLRSYDDHCEDGKCCHDCPNIGTCSSACPHLSGEVEKAQKIARKKGAKEKARKAKENEAVCAPKIRLWKRFGEARARAGLTFEEYARKADVRAFRREKKVADFEQGKKITPSSGGLPYAGGDGVDEWRIQPLIKASDALGCSVDYLLCRTDEPGMAKAEKAQASVPNEPTWQTGIPKHTGTYYCRIRFEEGKTMTLNLDYGTFNARWSHPLTGEEVHYEVLGWWPLPEDDPEDPEEEPEEDNEDDMDALWYGHEDDDDYVAEAGDVLGADE